jgi:hypothetical protein
MLVAQWEQTTYLGPAQVLKAGGNRAQLELPDELVWATVALAFPYQLAVGDSVLVIGQEGAWYVIGVLRGTGKTTFNAPGDLEIRAPRGSIELTAAKGVRIKSPLVELLSGKLEVLAESVFERYEHATRWVKEAFQLRVGRLRTRVETTYDLKANRILQRAEDDVKIDGRKIDLG